MSNYIITDSNAPGGPVYSWVDISGTGTIVTFDDVTYRDEGISPAITIGFNFPFYGHTMSELYVSTNGAICFTSSYKDYNTICIPGVDPQGVPANPPFFATDTFIAPYWADLEILPGEVYFQSFGTYCVIQFENVRFYSEPPQTTGLSFQAILYQDGTVLFQYKAAGYDASTGNLGVTAIVGLQLNSANGDSYSCREANLSDNLAVQFTFDTTKPIWEALFSLDYYQTTGTFIDATRGTGAYVNSIYAIQQTTDAQQLYNLLRYDGSAYEVVHSFDTVITYQVRFSPSGTMWVYGDTGTLVSTDGGATLLPSTDGLPVSAQYVVNFAFDSSGTTYGHNLGSGVDGWIYKLASGGSTWTKCSKPPEYDTYGVNYIYVDTFNSDRVWAVIVSDLGVSAIIYSDNAGGSWTDASGDLFVNNPTLYAATIYAKNNTVIVPDNSGSTTVCAVSVNGGTNWTLVTNTTGINPNTAVTTVAGYGDNVYIPDYFNGLWISTDGGIHWSLDSTILSTAAEDPSGQRVEYHSSIVSVDSTGEVVLPCIRGTFYNSGTYINPYVYVLTPPPAEFVEHNISGQVKLGGNALPGVTISYDSLPDEITDVNGEYSFHLASRNESTLIPSLTDYYFTPTSIYVPDSPTDVTGLDFEAHPFVPHYIRGTITLNGEPLGGVTVTYDSLPSQVTGADGTYSFYLDHFNESTLSASKIGYAISPASIAVANSDTDVVGQDFTAIQQYAVTFHAADGNAIGIAGVVITDCGTSTVTTDVNGDAVVYLFPGSYTYYYTDWVHYPPTGTLNIIVVDRDLTVDIALSAAAYYGITYKWYKNGALVQSSTNPTYTIVDYNATYYAEIWIGQAEVSTIAYTLPEFTPYPPSDNPVVLDAVGIADACYAWLSGCNFTPIPGETSSTFTATQSGLYTGIKSYMLPDGTAGEDSLTALVKIGQGTAVEAGPDQSTCSTIITMTGASPAGGVWSGTGITDGVLGTFDPAGLSMGDYTVTYTVGTCFDTKIVTVGGGVTDAGPDETTCLYPGTGDRYLLLTGATPPGGTWSGTGVDEDGYFDTAFGLGTFTVTYTYGCASDTKQVTIVPVSTDQGIADAGPDQNACYYIGRDERYITLTGATPPGGLWEGVGVVQPDLFDTAVGVGTYVVRYIYGCDSNTKNVFIHDWTEVNPSDIPSCDRVVEFTTASKEAMSAGKYSVEYDAGLDIQLTRIGEWLYMGCNSDTLVYSAPPHLGLGGNPNLTYSGIFDNIGGVVYDAGYVYGSHFPANALLLEVRLTDRQMENSERDDRRGISPCKTYNKQSIFADDDRHSLMVMHYENCIDNFASFYALYDKLFLVDGQFNEAAAFALSPLIVDNLQYVNINEGTIMMWIKRLCTAHGVKYYIVDMEPFKSTDSINPAFSLYIDERNRLTFEIVGYSYIQGTDAIRRDRYVVRYPITSKDFDNTSAFTHLAITWKNDASDHHDNFMRIYVNGTKQSILKYDLGAKFGIPELTEEEIIMGDYTSHSAIDPDALCPPDYVSSVCYYGGNPSTLPDQLPSEVKAMFGSDPVNNNRLLYYPPATWTNNAWVGKYVVLYNNPSDPAKDQVRKVVANIANYLLVDKAWDDNNIPPMSLASTFSICQSAYFISDRLDKFMQTKLKRLGFSADIRGLREYYLQYVIKTTRPFCTPPPDGVAGDDCRLWRPQGVDPASDAALMQWIDLLNTKPTYKYDAAPTELIDIKKDKNGIAQLELRNLEVVNISNTYDFPRIYVGSNRYSQSLGNVAIDQLAFYSRALTDDELAIYQGPAFINTQGTDVTLGYDFDATSIAVSKFTTLQDERGRAFETYINVLNPFNLPIDRALLTDLLNMIKPANSTFFINFS